MSAPPRVSIDRIKTVVAAHYAVPVAQLAGPHRDMKYAHPRHVAIYLACCLTPLSRTAVGRLFGHRDHSTIFHADWKIAHRRAIDRDFDQRIRTIETELALAPEPRPEVQLAFLIGPLFDRDPAAPQPTLRMLEAA